jgi:hypothetical protein
MNSSVLHAHSYAVWQDRESDRKVEQDALQCAHCSGHFFVVKGSGKQRGYCTNCAAVTCGNPKCGPCLHWKKKIELLDAGRANKQALFNGQTDGLPVSVSIPAAIPGPKKLILPE